MHLLIILILTPSLSLASNVEDIRAIARWFNGLEYSSCTFNGYLVDCKEMVRLKAKQKKLKKTVDPNLMRP